MALWKADPLRVITIYRQAIGLNHGDPLPSAITPIRIIEAIIAREFSDLPDDAV